MARKSTYWITTGLFCAMFFASGFGYLMGAEQFVEGITHLGYPLYLLTILGAAKIAAAIVLLAPGLSLLKEWAYAGVAIDLVGAAASHAFNGDAFAEIVPPLIVMAVACGSYLLRPESRRLPSSPTLGQDAAAS